MSKIEKLTRTQIARMPEWVDKWIKIGLSTERLDWDMAVDAVRGCYKCAGITPPLVILRMDSPYACVLGGIIGSLILSTKVGSQVGSQVESQVWSQVESQLVNHSRHAQLWAGWYSYITFLRDVCEWCNESLSSFIHDEHLALSCGWTWWHDKICAVSDRPLRINRDSRHRLHSYDSLAIEYPDGWGVAAIHGVRVSEKYVLTAADKIDPAEVMAEGNADVRSAVISKMGFARILSKLKTREISKAPGGETLLDINLGSGRMVRGIHAKWEEKDGMHETVIPVWWRREQFGDDCPGDINDCEQVRRWTLRWPRNVRIVAES